jgi:hypothetical protein
MFYKYKTEPFILFLSPRSTAEDPPGIRMEMGKILFYFCNRFPSPREKERVIFYIMLFDSRGKRELLPPPSPLFYDPYESGIQRKIRNASCPAICHGVIYGTRLIHSRPWSLHEGWQGKSLVPAIEETMECKYVGLTDL